MFLNGLNQFENNHKNFHKLDAAERLTIIKENATKKASSEIAYFLNSVKHLAIQGYMNSEYILTEQIKNPGGNNVSRTNNAGQ